MSQAFRLRQDGIDLYVRLTPKAAKDAIDGVETASDGRSHVKARVRAIPEKGEANAALERLIAKAFGVPASAVSISAGQTARLKTVRIVGAPAQLAGKAEKLQPL